MTSSAVFSPEGITSATNVVKLAQPSRRVVFSDPHFEDWQKIRSRLEKLSQLEKGWDGYQGVPMNFQVGYFAQQIIENFCGSYTQYLPDIIPGANGDVQIEWHWHGKSIELHVEAPYAVTAWRNNDAFGEDGEEVKLTNDFTAIGQWLQELTQATPVNEAAAA